LLGKSRDLWEGILVAASCKVLFIVRRDLGGFVIPMEHFTIWCAFVPYLQYRKHPYPVRSRKLRHEEPKQMGGNGTGGAADWTP
jgi:hypothetical protein